MYKKFFKKYKYSLIFSLILIIGFSLRIYSAIKMGWLAEDVFFIDFIEKWFSKNFLSYFFQWQHNIFPPRSPEFGTPPLGMWLQTIGVFFSEKYHFSELLGARLITIIFSQIGIIYIYKIGKNFFSITVGLLASFFISITPSIIAIDSSAHVDSFLSVFLIIAIYYILYFLKKHNYYHLYIASIFLGLSCLIKIYALIMIILIILSLFIYFLYNKLEIKKFIFFVLIIILIPPLLWSGLRDTSHLERTLKIVLGVGSLGAGVGTGGIFSEYDGIEGYSEKSIYYNLFMIFGKMLPLVSIFFVLYIPVILFFKKYSKIILLKISLLMIFIFFLAIYFFGGPNAVFNRIHFPSIIFCFISSISIEYFILKIKKRYYKKIIIYLIISISIISVARSNVHFFNAYNNFLIGGVANASKLYRVGHGEGLELASAWLKNNMNYNDIVYAPRINFITKYLPDINLAYAPLNKSLDYSFSQGTNYIVLHNSFFSGGLKPELIKDLDTNDIKPFYNVIYDNYPYIRIYKLDPTKYLERLPNKLFINFNEFGLKSNNSNIKYSTSTSNNILEFNYNIKKNEYIYTKSSLLLENNLDGVAIEMENYGDVENNIYLDVGKKNVGYYRLLIKNNPRGKHTFYVFFNEMENKIKFYNIHESNYIKISLDNYINDSSGKMIINEIYTFKKLKNYK